MTPGPTGGSLTLAPDLELTRIGYGAMQLAGPGVWGPPRDRDEAIAVLRAVVDLGITHLDTSDFYGPFTVNELIREALHPYPEQLRIVTKVGARRGPDKSWPHARSRPELIAAVHDNLARLGLARLDVVNLRMGGVDGPTPGSIAEQFTVLAELQQEGLIRHLGVSTIDDAQLTEATSIAPVVCVQNKYNVADRGDEAMVERCAADGIAYVPYFPLGGFSPLQNGVLDDVAARVEATSRQVALAWLLQHSPSILLIPGTSTVAHLHENVAAATLELPADAIARLDAIGS